MLQRRLSYALASALWLACAFELAWLILHAFRGTLEREGILGHLLTQPSLTDRAAPLAVILVFCWILLQVLIHTIRISRESTAVQQLKTWAADALKKLPESVRAGRRAKLVLKYQVSSPGKLLEALPAAGALDAVALENSYTLLKAYVWTLPVLGFIGTAWGMAHAIGGFSESLKVAATTAVTNSHQVMQIGLLTDRLGQTVIPGLSNAFSITMLALGCSILAHFWTTTLQAWDQDVLWDLDKASVEKLTEIAPVNGSAPVRDESMAQVSKQLGQLVAQLGLLLGRLDLGDAAESLGVAADLLKNSAEEQTSAAQRMRDAASEIHASARAPYHITITREAVS